MSEIEIGRSRFSFWSDWAEWFRGDYNWLNFTFVEVMIEHSPYKESSEINIAFMGLHMCALWHWGGDEDTHEADEFWSAATPAQTGSEKGQV